jgi:8-oxo-dGTP diphosphatase
VSDIAVTVDVVVLTIRSGRLSVLLVRRGAEPFLGEWALPCGFVAVDEDLDAAAARELCEETGLDEVTGHLEQLRTYGAPGRDPRMRIVSVAYVALMPDLPPPAAGSDADEARYWAVEDLEGPDAPQLGFDHEDIVRDAVERARSKLEYTSLAASFTDDTFTLGDLRRVYEAVWGAPLHAPNFRRKVLSTPGFVVPLDERSAPGDAGGRPAQLFRRGEATLLHPAFLRPSPEDEDA